MNSTHQAQNRDPVCGMSVDPATAKYSHVHQGTTWYFCADNCRQQFIAKPEQFLPSTHDGTPIAKRPRASLTREVLIAIAVFVTVVALLVMARGIARKTVSAQPGTTAVGTAAGRDQAIDAGQGGVISQATFDINPVRKTALERTQRLRHDEVLFDNFLTG